MFYKIYVIRLGFCGNSAALHALRYASVRHASEGSVTKPPTRGRVPTTLLQHGMVQVGFGGGASLTRKKTAPATSPSGKELASQTNGFLPKNLKSDCLYMPDACFANHPDGN